MLMILYQFIFYAHLILCFTSLKSVLSLLHYIVNSVQYNSGLIGSPTIYISTSTVGYLLCIYCVSMYLLVHCSAEMSFNLVSSASLINLLPNVS